MKQLVRYTRSVFLLITFIGLLSFSEAAENNSIQSMKSDLYYLASEECEGRGVETQGINKAADYIAKSFKEFGLKPITKDGSYFQPFKISSRARLGAKQSLVFKGPQDQLLEMTLNKQFSVTGYSSKKQVKGDLVFVGYGISLEDKSYDDFKGVDVEGKIVVILRKTPRSTNTVTPFPDADNQSYLATKIANAEKAKAAAIVFVNEYQSSKEQDTLMAYEQSRGATPSAIPVIHVKRSIIDSMLANSSMTLKDIEAGIDTDLKPKSFPIKGWKADLDIAVERGEIPAKNVIGLLEGKGPLAKEYIVIGAHYDHLGRGETGSLARGSKDIHYGADDNGSGTTGMLELARRFSSNKKWEGRSIIFMAFSGEERGLLGSAYYCNKEPLKPLEETVAMINLDMIGRLRKEAGSDKMGIEIGGVGSAKNFEELLDKLNKKYDFQVKKTRSGVGPSDHTSFYQKGVPVYFLFTGLHAEYHRPTDKPETINLDGMKKVVDMAEEMATIVGSTKERPVYVKGAVEPRRQGGGTPGAPRISFMPAEYNEDENRGVPIGSVTAGGPAEKGGLKQGDWIVEVAGKKVKNMTEYMTEMAKAKRGEDLELTVERNKKQLKLKVQPIFDPLPKKD